MCVSKLYRALLVVFDASFHFSILSDIEEQRRFVQTYLSSSGETPSDEEVENLLGLIAKYTLASHIFWGLWGIISVSSLILVPNAYVPIR
jgi:hypothetical protein